MLCMLGLLVPAIARLDCWNHSSQWSSSRLLMYRLRILVHWNIVFFFSMLSLGGDRFYCFRTFSSRLRGPHQLRKEGDVWYVKALNNLWFDAKSKICNFEWLKSYGGCTFLTLWVQERELIPSTVVDEIVSLNNLDMDLYKHAEILFAKQQRRFTTSTHPQVLLLNRTNNQMVNCCNSVFLHL